MFAPVTASADYSTIVPDKRRRRLLDAAMAVMADHTLETVTMDHIAKEAGVTRITLYREFGDRSTLMEAVAAFRLMTFDEQFFVRTDLSRSLASVVKDYLIASTSVSKNNPVSRRWAGGGMKFLHAGSLIHLTATATWSAVLKNHEIQGGATCALAPEDIGLWLIVQQYSLGRLVVETDCTVQTLSDLVGQFVSPAFLVPQTVTKTINQHQPTGKTP